MKRKYSINKTVIFKISGAIVFWFLIRDYLVSGSNVTAERYEFKVRKDSLMKVVTNFNNHQPDESIILPNRMTWISTFSIKTFVL